MIIRITFASSLSLPPPTYIGHSKCVEVSKVDTRDERIADYVLAAVFIHYKKIYII